MKRLLILILLLPFLAQAQSTVTVQRSTNGTINTYKYASPTPILDSLVVYTGGLTDGYILIYNSTSKKWDVKPTSTIIPTLSATSPIFYSGGVISSQPASATNEGYITTGAQTIAGDKTYNGRAIFGAGAIGFRTDTKIELRDTFPSISLFSNRNPGTIIDEAALITGQYDAGGNLGKTSSISAKWYDATSTTAKAVLRLNSTYNSGANDDVALRIFGKGGITLFGPDDLTSAGEGVLKTYGNITATGTIGSSVATGTAPLSIVSTTPVPNLSIGGNAATATILQNARTIGGVSFNGSANATVSTATAGFAVSGGDLTVSNDIILSNAYPLRGKDTFASTRRLISIEADNKIHIAQNNDEVVFGTGATTFGGAISATLFNGSATLTGSPTAPTQTAGDNSTKIATTAYVDSKNITSGTYNPTLTNVTNVTSSSVNQMLRYIRVGSIVSYSIEITINPTGVGLCQVDFTLPVPTNFTSVARIPSVVNENLSGSCSSMYVTSDITNDRASLWASSIAGAAVTLEISGHYEIE